MKQQNYHREFRQGKGRGRWRGGVNLFVWAVLFFVGIPTSLCGQKASLKCATRRTRTQRRRHHLAKSSTNRSARTIRPAHTLHTIRRFTLGSTATVGHRLASVLACGDCLGETSLLNVETPLRDQGTHLNTCQRPCRCGAKRGH